ncbi:MAG TPA: HAD family hydrolase [Azonexus sp.]|nr:HAD family hydrolase [Azonexus sp.]
MNRLHALIFDVDGTLAETERDGHRPAFNAAFSELGLDWHWDEALYRRLLDITGGKERIRHFAARHAPEMAAGANFEVLVRRLHLAKTAHYVRLVEQRCLPLRPGIARLIDEARQAGIRLAIATTTSPDNVEALLRASLAPEAANWFEVIGAGDIVAAKKPAPDIYCWVLDRLGLPADACLAIEDSENGLKSALTAGLRCLVTVSEYTAGQDFAGAEAVVSDLGTTSLADLVAIHGLNRTPAERQQFHKGHPLAGAAGHDNP